MLLQAILRCTGFYEPLSRWYLSTFRHELSDSIIICCIFLHFLSFLSPKKSTAHSREHLSSRSHSLNISSVFYMSPATLESQTTVIKSVPLPQEMVLISWIGRCWRSTADAHSPPLGHALAGSAPGCWVHSLLAAERQKAQESASPRALSWWRFPEASLVTGSVLLLAAFLGNPILVCSLRYLKGWL